jgi:prephenate dehydrogenase
MEKLCIIGVGLIGGCLALAQRQSGFRGEIVGCDRNGAALEEALALGIIDRAETDPARAVSGADAVVVAVPVGAMESVFAAIAPHLDPGAVITDVGSTKASVVSAARAVWATLPPGFVPAHPIAGTEKSGVGAAFPTLFRGRKVILTPLPESSPTALERVRTLWRDTGAEVVVMPVEHHDEVLAATSHLPHLLAFTLVDTLARMDDSWEIFRYAAGGFRDFTRIASSDPVMWHDICFANREAILGVLTRLEEDLDSLRAAIDCGDGAYVKAVFQRAKRARDHFSTIFIEQP